MVTFDNIIFNMNPKVHITKMVIILIIVTGFFPFGIKSQTTGDNCSKAVMLTKIFQKDHYNPHPLDDEFSERIFNRMFSLLDPMALIFTKKDLATLLPQRNTIDDQIRNEQCIFPKNISLLYKKKLIVVDSLLAVLDTSKFNYHHKDSLLFTFTGNSFYPVNDKDLKLRWQKYIMYLVMNRLALQFSSDTVTPARDSVFRDEKIIRRKIIIREKTTLQQKLKTLADPDFMQENFLNAIAMSYDPHSEYLPLKEKNGFEADLSSTKPSYGMELHESPLGEVTIDRIVPGGPAWKSNELNKGDILLQIKTASGKTIDMSETGIQEAEEIINEEKSDMITLTVKKPDGRTVTVKLVKEILANEDNLIQSFLLKGNKTIGYISLPGFYTNFSNSSELGCANDVAKEIIKLKLDKIDGLILDLRNNGGGSITEALALAGIFINQGPLLLVRYHNKKVEIRNDLNRGTIYNGPLTILVNGYSASASEIVTSILQEYHRALIVGTPTFGKATGQAIIPMDTTFNFNKTKDVKQQQDFVKITVEKLFCLNGQSYQKKGIIPDIIIPNPGAVFLEKESDDPTALKNETINEHPVFDTLPRLPVGKIKEKLAADYPAFNKITPRDKSSSLIKKEGNKILVSIDPDLTFERKKNIREDTVAKWKIEYPSMDRNMLNIDSDKKSVESGIKSGLANDEQLYKAFLATTCLIDLTK